MEKQILGWILIFVVYLVMFWGLPFTLNKGNFKETFVVTALVHGVIALAAVLAAILIIALTMVAG